MLFPVLCLISPVSASLFRFGNEKPFLTNTPLKKKLRKEEFIAMSEIGH